MSIDQIIDMAAVRNLFVSASGPVLVLRCVACARMLRSAVVGVLAGDLDGDAVVVIAVTHVQVPVV